jgi:hypothetical protein
LPAPFPLPSKVKAPSESEETRCQDCKLQKFVKGISNKEYIS